MKNNDNTILIILGVSVLGVAGYYLYNQSQIQQAQMIAQQQNNNDGGNLLTQLLPSLIGLL